MGAEWEVAGLELLKAGRTLPVVGPGLSQMEGKIFNDDHRLGLM